MLPSRPHESGLTLIELIIAIAAAATLLAIALPAYAALTSHTRIYTAQMDLLTALNQARLTAVARSTRVTICPSTDGQNCLRTTQWHGGWLVFTDRDRIGKPATSDAILQVGAARPADIAILSTAGRTTINYQPDGTAGGSNVTFTLCSRYASVGQAKTLVVSQAGRIRGGIPTTAAAATCLATASGA